MTGASNLLVAVAADLIALYHFLSETIGVLDHVSTLEATPRS